MKWYNKCLSLYGKPFNNIPINIIKEIRANIKAKQSDHPLVSIAIIAHNEEYHLAANIWSLSETISKYPIEFIGIDNNSSDRTAEIFETLGVPFFQEKRQSHGYARNCGLDHAKGDYYICIDSDTLYPPHYVEHLVKHLAKPGISGVYSLWSYIPDETHSAIGLFFYELCRDIYLYINSINRPELSVRGMVFAFKTEYGKKIRFRTNIKRGEDGMMANGLKDYGKIKYIYDRNARPVTGYRTIGNSLFHSFRERALKAFKCIPLLFTKQKEYKDIDSNIINKNTKNL